MKFLAMFLFLLISQSVCAQNTVCLNLRDEFFLPPCSPRQPSGCVVNILIIQQGQIISSFIPTYGGGVQCSQEFKGSYGEIDTRIEISWRGSGTNPQTKRYHLAQGYPDFKVKSIPSPPKAFGVR